MKDRNFEMVDLFKVAEKTRMTESRFVEEVKLANNAVSYRIRQFGESHGDEQPTPIAKKASATERLIQQHILSTLDLVGNKRTHTRHITQACLSQVSHYSVLYKSDPRREWTFPQRMALKIAEPPYCIPDLGLHWSWHILVALLTILTSSNAQFKTP